MTLSLVACAIKPFYGNDLFCTVWSVCHRQSLLPSSNICKPQIWLHCECTICWSKY